PVAGQGWCTTKVPAAPQTSVADPRTALMLVMIRGLPGPDGMVSGAHDVPFQCRTDVPSAAPAAQTLVGELAVTAVSWPPPPWCGTVGPAQAVPFQCIAMGLSAAKLPETVSKVFPTAHASVGEISTTPLRVWRTPLMALGVPGLGLGTIVQAEPFQCMVSVKLLLWVPFAAEKLPTAQMSFADRAAAWLSVAGGQPGRSPGVGGGDDTPGRAVPVLDQRAGGLAAADRPGVPAAQVGDPEQARLRSASDVRGRDDAPASAVPVRGQRVSVREPGLLFRADRPDVVRRGRRDRVQLLIGPEDVGRMRRGPCGAVPV